jgi:basic amino acid/polyamine antiporter, APA family
VIYIAVSTVAVGALPADELAGEDAPLAVALSEGAGISWAADIVTFGALVAITSVVLTILFGQTRICFSMSRDGLLPQALCRVNETTRTPILLTAIFGCAIALLAAFVPLAEIAKLVNIGTLFAFVLVNIGVIVLRRTKPELERGFRVPLVPVVPLIGAALCIFLMTYLDQATWIRFGAWMVLGLLVYGFYGYRRSRLRREGGGEAGAA